MNVKRIKNSLLSINHARKAVGASFFAEAVKSNSNLEILNSLDCKKALVLSPHPDDDVFGCGGTLKILCDKGAEIKVIYLANGSARKKSDNFVAQTRQNEAEVGAKIIGINSLVFWDNNDNELGVNAGTIKKLKLEIDNFKPDIIFSPALVDPHPDHQETAKLLAKTLSDVKFEGQIFQYEIWQPIFANRLITIDKTVENKKTAILAYKSQLDCRSYLTAILGLNQYRAGMFNAGEYAEAFFASNKELYLKLFDLMK